MLRSLLTFHLHHQWAWWFCGDRWSSRLLEWSHIFCAWPSRRWCWWWRLVHLPQIPKGALLTSRNDGCRCPQSSVVDCGRVLKTRSSSFPIGEHPMITPFISFIAPIRYPCPFLLSYSTVRCRTCATIAICLTILFSLLCVGISLAGAFSSAWVVGVRVAADAGLGLSLSFHTQTTRTNTIPSLDSLSNFSIAWMPFFTQSKLFIECHCENWVFFVLLMPVQSGRYKFTRVFAILRGCEWKK